MFSKFRWRLARLIAPVPIIDDPWPDAAAYFVYRNGGARASVRLTSIRMKMTNSGMDPAADTLAGIHRMVPSRGNSIRFIGTARG